MFISLTRVKETEPKKTRLGALPLSTPRVCALFARLGLRLLVRCSTTAVMSGGILPVCLTFGAGVPKGVLQSAWISSGSKKFSQKCSKSFWRSRNPMFVGFACETAVSSRRDKLGSRLRLSFSQKGSLRGSGAAPLVPFYFFKISTPTYLRSTSGMTTEPSAVWFCSTRAGRMREVARPEPLRVCTNSVLPLALLTRMLPRRA